MKTIESNNEDAPPDRRLRDAYQRDLDLEEYALGGGLSAFALGGPGAHTLYRRAQTVGTPACVKVAQAAQPAARWSAPASALVELQIHKLSGQRFG